MTVYRVGDTVRVTKLLPKDKKEGKALVVGGMYTVNESFRHGSICVTLEGNPEYVLTSDQIEKADPNNTNTNANATSTKKLKRVLEELTELVDTLTPEDEEHLRAIISKQEA